MRHQRRRGGVWLPVAVSTVVIGVLLVVFGLTRTNPAPGPGKGDGDGSGSAHPRAAAALPRSVPTRIRIPAIRVDAPVLALGLNADGTIAEPSLSQPQLTGWYKLGPAPGERGPAAFYGHVDTRVSGPAVFYNLGRLKPGAQVQVTRQDQRITIFQITSIEQVPKTRFPTEKVYGATPDPTIRLMTCGGEFDPVEHSYKDNIIAYGILTASDG